VIRALLKRFDRLLCKLYGIYIFSDDPNGVIRLQRGKTPHPLSLSGQTIQSGEPVLNIHLWNDHLPPLPAGGPDLVWAKKSERLFLLSLQDVAVYINQNPALDGVRAIGGTTIILYSAHSDSGERIIRRLGFTAQPHRGKLGKVGNFIDNLYSWVLIWTYNPQGLSYHQLETIRRTDIWISREDFLERFAAKIPAPLQEITETT
jgi:hypothetical protein